MNQRVQTACDPEQERSDTAEHGEAAHQEQSDQHCAVATNVGASLCKAWLESKEGASFN